MMEMESLSESKTVIMNESGNQSSESNGTNAAEVDSKIVKQPGSTFAVRDGSSQVIQEKLGENSATTVASSSIISSDTDAVPILKLNDSKAGMQGLDLKKINEIIENASKGSKFYMHKKKMQARLDEKIAAMQAQLHSLTPEQLAQAEKKVDVEANFLRDTRDLSRTIVHIDMDAFYAAVEMRDNPKLRDVPLGVGGNSMLSTSNYIARRFGVRAAMPGFVAKKLCPNLVIVPCNFPKYTAVSEQVQEIFMEYDPNFSAMSLDEAYLDITDFLTEKGFPHSQITPDEVVSEIRQKIFDATQLTASAGIAPNGMLAKICGDMNKPNGQYRIRPNVKEIEHFLENLPIRKVCGIGGVTEQLLKGIGVNTCSDLWLKRGAVSLLFTPSCASFLLRVSLGIGHGFASSKEDDDADSRKSISCERTFKGTDNVSLMKTMCQELCKNLEEDVKSKNVVGKTVTLKIKLHTFETKTRAKSLLNYTADASVLFSTSWSILQSYLKELPGLKLRLMGVRLSNLIKTDCIANRQNTIDELFRKTAEKKIHDESSCDSMEDIFQMEERNLVEHKESPVAGPSESSNVQSGESSISETPKVKCPVCDKNVPVGTDINQHIDECLNMQTVREIMGTSSSGGNDFPLNMNKRSFTEENSAKICDTASKKRKKNVTIDSFFQKAPK